MYERIVERINELKDKDWEVEINAIILPEGSYAEEDAEKIDNLAEENGYEIIFDQDIVGFNIAYYEPDSGLGVPTPDRLERMADKVDVAGGGNIAHGTFDIFADFQRKEYDLDQDKMDEAEVDFEGDTEIVYDDEGTARIETLRFQARAEADPDDFSEDEVEQRVKDKLLGQAKEAVYSGKQVQDIKVNSPPPTEDEDELEEMEWVPDRIKVGELIYEFNKILLGDENADPEEGEEPEVTIEEVGEDVKRKL